MNEEARRPSIPTAASHNLLCCPCGSRVRRYVDVDNLPVRVVDHEENIKKAYGKEPFARRKNRTPRSRKRVVSGMAASSVMGFDAWVDGNCSSRNFVRKPGKLRLDPALTPKTVVDGHVPDQSP
jgi:hypothetical protein